MNPHVFVGPLTFYLAQPSGPTPDLSPLAFEIISSHIPPANTSNCFQPVLANQARNSAGGDCCQFSALMDERLSPLPVLCVFCLCLRVHMHQEVEILCFTCAAFPVCVHTQSRLDSCDHY